MDILLLCYESNAMDNYCNIVIFCKTHGKRTICTLRRYIILSVPYITANMYCKSRNLPNTDKRNYSIDLR